MIILGRKQFCERWDMVGGCRVFSRVSKAEWPAGRLPIVLVHGLGVSSRYMMPLANELGTCHPVLVPDLPGYGRSQKPKRVLDVWQLAAALRQWLKAVGIERSLFVGNSMGCQILVELAISDPPAVAGLAFLGPTMDQFAHTRLSHVGRLFLDQFMEPPSLIPLQAFDYLGNGPLRTVKTFAQAVKHDMLSRVAQVSAPCLILRGEKDPIASSRWIQALARNMPDAESGTIADAGHALNYNAAKTIAPKIIEFWRSRRIEF